MLTSGKNLGLQFTAIESGRFALGHQTGGCAASRNLADTAKPVGAGLLAIAAERSTPGSGTLSPASRFLPFVLGVSARRPVHLALTQHMHMYVIDGLPTFFNAVHHHTKAFLAAQFQGQALGGEENMPGQGLVLFGQVIERAYGFFRNDQEMHRCLWGDIVEGQDLVILVNDLGGYFSVDDLGEQSIHSCFSIEWVGPESVRTGP